MGNHLRYEMKTYDSVKVVSIIHVACCIFMETDVNTFLTILAKCYLY